VASGGLYLPLIGSSVHNLIIIFFVWFGTQGWNSEFFTRPLFRGSFQPCVLVPLAKLYFRSLGGVVGHAPKQKNPNTSLFPPAWVWGSVRVGEISIGGKRRTFFFPPVGVGLKLGKSGFPTQSFSRATQKKKHQKTQGPPFLAYSPSLAPTNETWDFTGGSLVLVPHRGSFPPPPRAVIGSLFFFHPPPLVGVFVKAGGIPF